MHRGSRRFVRLFFVPHPVHLLALALAVTALGLAACGDGDESSTSADSAESSEEIVIVTHIVFPRQGEGTPSGEIVGGSTIGDSPFCPGGSFRDGPGQDAYDVEKNIDCPDGTLTIGFSPGEPAGHKQTGPWEVLGGTGAYEGLQGEGEMEVTGSDREGRETFTGTVTP
jgi:hypothetical protein